jgi:hypothetical protein
MYYRVSFSQTTAASVQLSATGYLIEGTKTSNSISGSICSVSDIYTDPWISCCDIVAHKLTKLKLHTIMLTYV